MPTRRQVLDMLLRGRLFAEYTAPIFTGVSVPHLSPEQIRAFPVASPRRDEQDQMCEKIEAETPALDVAISQAEREVSLIREYRTRLVADVVTGQLHVRAAAARLPTFDPDEPAPADLEGDATHDDLDEGDPE